MYVCQLRKHFLETVLGYLGLGYLCALGVLLVHVPELVRLHLAESEHRVLALSAVVVRLLPVVRAPAGGAELCGRVLVEAGCHDRVELLVLAPVGHHLVGVGAVVVAL